MDDLGPAAGHRFHFAVTVQSSYRIEGDPQYYDSDLDTAAEPFRLTVRAWSLTDACQVAAQTPFGLWTQPGEEPHQGMESGSDGNFRR